MDIFSRHLSLFLSLPTLPKSAPNKRGGAWEKSESSIKPFSLGLSCCSGVFLSSAAKCCEAFPRRTRAAWVLATAALGVISPASSNFSTDTRGFTGSRRSCWSRLELLSTLVASRPTLVATTESSLGHRTQRESAVQNFASFFLCWALSSFLS